jgi:hypothetical protein
MVGYSGDIILNDIDRNAELSVISPGLANMENKLSSHSNIQLKQ